MTEKNRDGKAVNGGAQQTRVWDLKSIKKKGIKFIISGNPR